MSTLRNITRFSVFALGSFAALSYQVSSAAEASTVKLTYGYTVPEFTPTSDLVTVTQPNVRSAPVRVEQDEALPTASPCCVNGAVRNVFQSRDNAIAQDEFGSRVELGLNDAGRDSRSVEAEGQIISRVRADTLLLPFTISNTKLRVGLLSTAELNFNIFVVESQPTGTVTAQDVLDANGLKSMSYKATLSAGEFSNPAPNISILQSGFDLVPPEPDLVDASIPGRPAYEWDFGVFNGVIDLASAGLNIGDVYGLIYEWGVKVDSEAGGGGVSYASFFDPLGGGGGLSIDTTGMTFLPLGGATTPTPPTPSAVPLPASAVLLLTGLFSLLLGSRQRSQTAV